MCSPSGPTKSVEDSPVDRQMRSVRVKLAVKQFGKTEVKLTDKLTIFFDDQLASIRSGLKRASGTDPEKVARRVFNPREWDKELKRTVVPVLAQAMVEGAAAELVLLGYDPRKLRKLASEMRMAVISSNVKATIDGFTIQGVDLPEGMGSQLPEWMVDEILSQLSASMKQPHWNKINDTTLDDLETKLANGMAGGESVQDIADKIVEAWPETYSESRAKNVARTECLPGETVVSDARVVAAYRRWYSGPWVTVITKGKRKLAGTPNHPVLTKRGWIGLGDLKESDSLICYRRSVEELRPSGDQNVATPPATISEIFDSLSAVGVASRKAGAKPDFHGDGMNGDIDILRSDRHLLYGRCLSFDQLSKYLDFTKADVAQSLLSTPSYFASVGIGQERGLARGPNSASVATKQSSNRSSTGTNRCSDRLAGFSGLISSDDFIGYCRQLLVGSVAGLHQLLSSFLVGPSASTVPLQKSSYSAGVAMEVLGNFDGAITGSVSTDNFLRVWLEHRIRSWCEFRVPRLAAWNSVFPQHLTNVGSVAGENISDCLSRAASQIEIDHPLIIRTTETYSGHVFNLTTEDGFFIANSFVTSNCGHALNAGRDLSYQRLKDELPPDAAKFINKEWLSVLGPTTRATHADADGQYADEDGMFEVGGYSVPWPAHYDLPPEERCNCQCTTTTAFGAGAPDDEIEEILANGALSDEEGIDDLMPTEDTPEIEVAVEPPKPWHESDDILEFIGRDSVIDQYADEFTAQADLLAKEAADAAAEYEAINSEWDSLRSKLNVLEDEFLQSDADRRTAITAEVDAASDLLEKLRQRILNHKQIDVLDKARRILMEPIDKQASLPIKMTSKDADRRAKTKSAAAFITGVSVKSMSMSEVELKATNRKRSFHWSGSINMSKDANVATYVHEIGHHFEYKSGQGFAGIQKAAQAFVKARIAKAGTPDVKMRRMFPKWRFDAGEIGNKDGFEAAWSHLPEQHAQVMAHYNGKVYKSGATELIAMGLERLYLDPITFARTDPEYFRFILGVVKGRFTQ